jgi:hypothetical protein
VGAAALFIFGLKCMSSPRSARLGMLLAAGGMAAAMCGTMLDPSITAFGWIAIGVLVGTAIGAYIAIVTPMTHMPQRTALSHAFGALAAALVGVAHHIDHGETMGVITRSALTFEVLLGSLTVTGSLLAFAKLQGWVKGSPMVYQGQNVITFALLGVMTVLMLYCIVEPNATWAFYLMALLALPIARRQAPRVLAIERSLATLTDDMARDGDRDEKLLGELSRLAAEVESGLAASSFRFGAARAYHDLVNRRIVELRETRIAGFQTIDEFMNRRLAPAMATCTSVSRRLQDLSERVARASALLSTRVDIARERQNQALLASMDRRALLQLRLQETVEGLSVAAISYYALGLLGYVLKAVAHVAPGIDPNFGTGLAAPVVIGLVWYGLRLLRQRATDETNSMHRPPAP